MRLKKRKFVCVCVCVCVCVFVVAVVVVVVVVVFVVVEKATYGECSLTFGFLCVLTVPVPGRHNSAH